MKLAGLPLSVTSRGEAIRLARPSCSSACKKPRKPERGPMTPTNSLAVPCAEVIRRKWKPE